MLVIVEELEARAQALRDVARTVREAEAQADLIRFAEENEAEAKAMRKRRELR